MVLQDLLRTRYASHLKSPQFSDLVAECKEIFAGIMKILESNAVIVEDSESKSKVDDKPEPGPGVVAKLVSLQGDSLRAHGSCRAAH